MTTKQHLLTFGLIVGFAATGLAQRGTGEAVGLARQGVQAEPVHLEGTLERVETGPCKHTTGEAVIGVHLFLRVADDQLINLHVGAAEAVSSFTDSLEPGTTLRVEAFRTERLPDNHYIARVIETEDESFEVRNEDLQPFWAAERRWQRREMRREQREEQRRQGGGRWRN